MLALLVQKYKYSRFFPDTRPNTEYSANTRPGTEAAAAAAAEEEGEEGGDAGDVSVSASAASAGVGRPHTEYMGQSGAQETEDVERMRMRFTT